MLKFLLLLLIGLSMTCNAFCQEKNKKTKKYKAWVSLLDSRSVVKGYFNSAKDSSILILNPKNNELIEVPIHQINKIKIRRKNRIGRATAIGAASGLLFGAITGYADGDDPPETWLLRQTAEEKATVGAIAAIPIGAGIGAAIGSIKKTFKIGGSMANYRAQKPLLINTVF